MAAPKTSTRTAKGKAPASKGNKAASKGNKAPAKASTEPTTTPDPSKAEDAKVAKEAERQRKADEKVEAEEKARQAKIESGDMIVSDDGREFEITSKETKVSTWVSQITEVYRADESGVPLVYADVVEQVGAKYSEDLIPGMHALEDVGLVQRFGAGNADSNRKATAYLWVGER